MKISIICGSSRAESQSLKVSKFLEYLLKDQSVDCEIIDLYTLDLPHFDPDNQPKEKVEELRSKLDASDGFIFVSPEWDGMMNHRIVSFIHYIGFTLADKPVMLTGVSATYHGGHYPVEQMRMLGPKNKHYVVIPEHLIVMNANDVMNSHDLEGDEKDQFIKKRAHYATKTLVEYAKALQHVRQSGVTDYDTYPNGM